MTRKAHKKERREPGRGSRLRNSETFRVTSNHDQETFLHIRQLAVQSGVTISEQMRQLVEFGLETIDETKGKDAAPVLQSLKPEPKLLKINEFVEFVDVAKPKQTDGDAKWHILIAEAGREETARRGLVSRGFAPYLPVIHKEISAGRARKRDVPRAMFTCYLFLPVVVGKAPYDRIMAVPGVADFMTINCETDGNRFGWRSFAILTDEAVEAIRKRESAIEAKRQAKIALRVNGRAFEIGQNVAVPMGQFDMLAGKITRVLGKNVDVLLEMELLGRKVVTVAAGNIINRE